MRTRIRIDDMSFMIKLVHNNSLKDMLKDFLENIKNDQDKLRKISDGSLKLTTEDIPKFKYDNLMNQIETYQLTGTPFDIKIHNIDEFMVDVYRTYFDLEKQVHNEEGLNYNEEDEEMNLSDIIRYVQKGTKSATQEFSKLKIILHDIMLYFEFTETEIRGIQKNYLNDMLNEAIQAEDYDSCIIIRDRINNF